MGSYGEGVQFIFRIEVDSSVYDYMIMQLSEFKINIIDSYEMYDLIDVEIETLGMITNREFNENYLKVLKDNPQLFHTTGVCKSFFMDDIYLNSASKAVLVQPEVNQDKVRRIEEITKLVWLLDNDYREAVEIIRNDVKLHEEVYKVVLTKIFPVDDPMNIFESIKYIKEIVLQKKKSN